MNTQKKNLTVKEIKSELDSRGIKYSPAAKKDDLVALLPQENLGGVGPEEEKIDEEIKESKLSLNFDIPGKINHEKFDKGGKAERTFIALCKEPKKVSYISLEVGDIPGAASSIKQFCYNRLAINVVKGIPVEMPESLANYIDEIEAIKRTVMNVKTRNLMTGGLRDARLDLLTEAQKMGVL